LASISKYNRARIVLHCYGRDFQGFAEFGVCHNITIGLLGWDDTRLFTGIRCGTNQHSSPGL